MPLNETKIIQSQILNKTQNELRELSERLAQNQNFRDYLFILQSETDQIISNLDLNNKTQLTNFKTSLENALKDGNISSTIFFISESVFEANTNTINTKVNNFLNEIVELKDLSLSDFTKIYDDAVGISNIPSTSQNIEVGSNVCGDALRSCNNASRTAFEIGMTNNAGRAQQFARCAKSWVDCVVGQITK
jgi:hypothetical protein